MSELKWSDINGYEGYYQVSNTGLIKRLESKANHWLAGKRIVKERILKPSITNKNYARLMLSIDNKKKNFFVHRIVAETFISKKDDSYEVNHIDGNKLNNNSNNLEWVNRSENMLHAYEIGLWNNQYTKN